MTTRFGIAAVQMAVVPWDPDATVTKMADAVQQISQVLPWIDMVVFHELAVPGLVQFVTADPVDAWRRNAEPIPGPSTDRLCDIARKRRKWLVPGSMYERDGDHIYNTALAISPAGEIVAKYRKMFPWLPYEAGTTPGDSFCVFDVPEVGRFGLAICYDIWFPEMCRTLAWLGAEVILQPTMTPTSDRPLELVMAQANAIFNQCYLLSVNGIGPYGGGQSLLVDADGRVLQQAAVAETILTEIIDLERVRFTREYGTLGLAQTLKQLRDCGHHFPLYEKGKLQEGSFGDLGPLALQRSLAQPLRPKDA